MRTLFLLNPTAGKADCTRALPQQIDAAAVRAGLARGEYTIRITAHAGHARELANAAARQARQAGEQLRIYTAGGDGTSPASMGLKMRLWAACPMAAAMISCVLLAQKRNFWIWTPSLQAGRSPLT